MEDTQRLLGSLEQFKEYTGDRLDKMDQKLDSIVIQTTITNGRVNALEKQKSKAEKLRDKIIWILIGGASSLLLTLISYHLLKK